ncbi:unnamed protein product [Candidula unifasciata]|uniref:CABIT domain-containing protein n=1 Tax=Candidula unifasciata TaxID=100452 RepID=A0A8S3ZH08_9EUPU|nr:unnamed protein product [Candidula unifasciata]
MTETKRKVISSRDITSSAYSPGVPENISEFAWDDKSLTLRELIVKYHLPLTVKLKASEMRKCIPDSADSKCTCKDSNSAASSKIVHSCSSRGAGEINFTTRLDSTSTSLRKLFEISDAVGGKNKHNDWVLQIHEVTRKKIMLARKMTWDKRQNDYVVTGGQMEIPASIKGWVEVLPENGRPVEYYDTIDGIASLNPRRFLVRTSTVGYQLTTDDGGNCCWMPSEIKPGEILTAGIIYVDSKKTKSSQKGFLKKLWKHEHAKKEEDVKYLQCFDPSGSEIMIPLFMSGVFSPIGDSSFANYDAVYEFKDLIMAFGLPVNVQLVHVNATESIQCPKGVIRLYGIREEEVVVASKVRHDGDLLKNNLDEKFELPLDTQMEFSRGIMRKKTSKLRKAVNGQISPDEHTHLAKPLAEECKMKTIENSPNAPVKKVAEISDQRASMVVKETVKCLTAESPLRKQQAELNHNDITTPTQTVNNHKLESDYTTRELHTPFTHSDCTRSSEHSATRDVELPEKAAKEPKSRNSNILEKLSVRKVKKVRAKLKELRSEDVFSKRLSRSELTYSDFYKDLENERKIRRNSEHRISMQDNCRPGSREDTYHTGSLNNELDEYPTGKICASPKTSSVYVSNTYLLKQRRASMQKRELPPVPIDSDISNLALPSDSTNLSKESEYEHLPQAPQLPHFRRASDSAVLDSKYYTGEDTDDDYMLPVQMQQESRYAKRSDFQAHHRSPGLATPNVPAKGMWSRDAYKERSGDSPLRGDSLDRRCSLDNDDVFKFTYSPTQKQHKLQVGAEARPSISSRQASGIAQMAEWTRKLSDNHPHFEQTFLDNLNMETRSQNYASRDTPRFSKHTIINPNATIRSHNLRNIFPNVKDVFSLYDNQHKRHMFDNSHVNHMQNCSSQQRICSCSSCPQMFVNPSTDNTAPQPCHHHFHNLCDNNYGIHYPETDANVQPKNGTYFFSDFRDSYNQGDDSAISACSRGDIRYINDGEYNSNDFGEHTQDSDDGWMPPNQIEGLSVQEVSKSLRYIGMKDRVVLRLSQEQIDGSMLCTLDEKLLKDGFPELNALEVKKILDFIQGWRPKKS